MKRRRSAAQKAATRRMLAARRHRNPSPAPKRYTRRRRNPSPVAYRARRRRNPSVGGGSILNELMSKDGLMMIAAVVGTPTLTELAVQYMMPTASGTTKSLVKAGMGLGIAYGVYKFLNKKAGLVVALVSTGSAISDLINSYMSPSLGTSAAAAPAVVSGYTSGRRIGMSGYGRPAPEPGLIRF